MWKVFMVSVLVGLSLLITGCASVNLQMLDPIDQQDKTISMRAGGRYLTGDIKTALRRDGWKVYALDSGREITRDKDKRGKGTEVAVYRESQFAKNARYRLIDDWVMNPAGSMVVEFDISIIDNKNGQEVIILSGQHKDSADVVKILIDSTYGKDYQGWGRVK